MSGKRLRSFGLLVCLAVALASVNSPCHAAAPDRPVGHAGPAGKARKPAAAQADQTLDIVTYGRRDDVMGFAAEVAQDQQLDRSWVEATLAKARFQPSVARLIMPPAAGVAKNWAAYRARFVEPQRIRAGLAFWAEHQAWLEAAQARFGVPAEIVVGIIGVETFYGAITGSFRVLDALATLAFDFPVGRKDRSAFFRDELGHFLALTRRDAVAPETLLGSYAGAIGLGQFMPSSIRRYAIDFDRDGHVDMAGSPADVIGSVANYLAAFGWKPGMATHYAVQPPLDTSDRAALLLPDILPTFTAEQMAGRGAVLSEKGSVHDGALALVELHNGAGAPSHVAGTQNFYALTRYNWSSYYALAVIELGQAIKARRPAERNAAASAETSASAIASVAASVSASASAPASAASASTSVSTALQRASAAPRASASASVSTAASAQASLAAGSAQASLAAASAQASLAAASAAAASAPASAAAAPAPASAAASMPRSAASLAAESAPRPAAASMPRLEP